mgnify:CR=1 FL=1
MLGIPYGTVEMANDSIRMRRTFVKKYDILGFISECYELLHVNSYICFVSIIHSMEPDFNSSAQ